MLSGIARVATRLSSAPIRGFATAKSVTVKVPPLQGHARLDEKTYPTETTITADQALKYYTDMQTIRKMEVACDNMYKNREIRGFCHLADGQEAIAVGIEAAVTYDDPLITAYRDHGQIYMRGDSVFQIIAEMLGKSAGSSKGKGGSMHYYRGKHNFYGGNGIVGAQLPVGTGLAFALKYMKKKNCAIAMYGDGSANQGQLFEAANMAKLWNLPVVYVCENNKYGMGTSVSRASANTKFYERLELVPGIKVDGFNIISVRESMAFAKKWCVEGKGPICIEYSTYRYHGHSMSDPGISYRKREEIQEVRAKQDCIFQIKNIILDNKLATEDKLKEIDKSIKEVVDKAVEDARAAPLPKPEEVYADIYTEKDSFFIRGVEWEKSVFVDGKAI